MLNLSYFVHPIPLLTVAILALNDHYLKWHYTSVWTGKLSDFAGMFFFPLFLCAFANLFWNVLEWVRDSKKLHWISRKQLFVAILAADIIFASTNLHTGVAHIYVEFLGAIGFPSVVTMDSTDLIALTMNIPTWIFAGRFFDRSFEVDVTNELAVIPARDDELF